MYVTSVNWCKISTRIGMRAQQHLMCICRHVLTSTGVLTSLVENGMKLKDMHTCKQKKIKSPKHSSLHVIQFSIMLTVYADIHVCAFAYFTSVKQVLIFIHVAEELYFSSPYSPYSYSVC